MGIDYKLFINNGVDAFGTTGKTLSIEEQPKTVSVDFLADAIHSQNELISKGLAREVLNIFGVVASRLMAEGLGLQFQHEGNVLLRLYTDARIKDGNINLTRARELTHDSELTEEQMVARAGELVGLAGIQLRAYAEVQPKFTELIKTFHPVPNNVGIVERARIERKDNSGSGDNQGDNQGGGDNGGGDDLNPGENDG